MNVKEKAIETMVSAIKVMAHEEMYLSCLVKVGKKGLTIPTSQIAEVKCRIRAWPEGGVNRLRTSTGS
jgi:hypothetical protein